jgi:hypothetical protein
MQVIHIWTISVLPAIDKVIDYVLCGRDVEGEVHIVFNTKSFLEQPSDMIMPYELVNSLTWSTNSQGTTCDVESSPNAEMALTMELVLKLPSVWKLFMGGRVLLIMVLAALGYDQCACLLSLL